MSTPPISATPSSEDAGKWFEAIEKGDMSSLSKLIYSSPNPKAGVDRLSWISPATKFDKCSEVMEKLGICPTEELKELWALPFAILSWYQNGKSKKQVDCIKIICHICPAAMIDRLFDGGNTVLHLAAVLGNVEIIRSIMEKRPDPTLKNTQAKLAVDVASLLGRNMMQDYYGKYTTSGVDQGIVGGVTDKVASMAPKSVSNSLKIPNSGVPLMPAIPSKDQVSLMPPGERKEPLKVATKHLSKPVEQVVEVTEKVATVEPKDEAVPNEITESKVAKIVDKEEIKKEMVEEAEVEEATISVPEVKTKQSTDSVLMSNRAYSEENALNQLGIDMDAAELELITQQLLSAKLKQPTSDAVSAKSAAISRASTLNKSNRPPMFTGNFSTSSPEKQQESTQKVTRKPLNITPQSPEGDAVSDIVPEDGKSRVKSQSGGRHKNVNDIFSTASKDDNSANSFNDEKKYSTLYKKSMILVDQETSNEPGKNVIFKNSWRGELEKTRKFCKDAATVQLAQQIGRPLISELTFQKPKSGANSVLEPVQYGKMFIHLKGLRGVVVNCNKEAEKTSFYCCIRSNSDGTVKVTKPVRFGPENMYTTIPLAEEFAFNTENGFEFQIDLKVKYEFDIKRRKTGLFRASSITDMFQKRTGRAGSGRSSSRMPMFGGSKNGRNAAMNKLLEDFDDRELDIHEETVCSITINRENTAQLKISESPVEFKTKWNIVPQQQHRPIPVEKLERSSSRASMLSSYLASKIGIKPKQPDTVDISVAEAGSLTLKLFHIADLNDEVEQQMVPLAISDAVDWLKRKQWNETCWTEGYLSQQGGDVKFWRRRYFKIVGAKMQAHHEFSKELRTTIDLSQVTGLDDYTSANDDGGDDESYATANSFRLHFKHGESIDFYAESKELSQEWIGKIKKIIADIPDEPLYQTAGTSSADGGHKRRSPKKKLSISGFSVPEGKDSDGEGENGEDEYRAYDKRYKTPATKKGVSLLKKRSNSIDADDHQDDDIVGKDSDDLKASRELADRLSGSGSASHSSMPNGEGGNRSYVGMFGTQRTSSIPEL